MSIKRVKYNEAGDVAGDVDVLEHKPNMFAVLIDAIALCDGVIDYAAINALLPEKYHCDSKLRININFRLFMTKYNITFEQLQSYYNLSTLDNTFMRYLITEGLKPRSIYTGYKNYTEFKELSDINIYRSLSNEKLLIDFVNLYDKVSHPYGVIKQITVYNCKSPIITKNDARIMRRVFSHDSGDIISNIKCYLMADKIILSELPHVVTINRDTNEIYQHDDIIIPATLYTEYALNIMLPKEIIPNNYISFSYDATYLSEEYRDNLQFTTDYDTGKVVNGHFVNNEVCYMS